MASQPESGGRIAPIARGVAQRTAFTLRALGSRNFRLFFFGQIVSLVGTWLSMLATSWLAYRLAREGGHPEALVLGLVGFASQLPSLVLTPVAGVWIDRWNRHRILVVTQTLAMIQSFALAYLTLGGWITIGQLMALAAFQGLINAFDMPGRQAFLVEMVDRREDLSNAIALNSSMFHGARLVGPALAGIMIAVLRDEGYCFLLDGFSYLAVIVSLLLIRVPRRQAPSAPQRAWAAFFEGLRYAFGFPPIRVLILTVAVTSLTVMAQATLMPLLAAQVLGGNELTLGWLSSATGFGALVGSLYLASRRSVLGLGRLIAQASAALGCGLLLLSLSRILWLSLPILVVNGAAVVVLLASANTMLQTIVEDDKRGRVMALFTMAFFGMAPVGALLGGSVATLLGVPTTLALCGLLALMTAAVFALYLPVIRPLVRPIYESKGIVPQVAEALEATDALSESTNE